MLFTMNVIFLSDTGSMQQINSQHCGYWFGQWWPAPGHQSSQFWVCTHAFPDVYGLRVAVWYEEFFALSLYHMTQYMSGWRHQMETFPALLAHCAGNSPATGEFPSQRPVTRNSTFSLICAWTNGWVNHRQAGGLRRHRAYYDVTVMLWGIVRSRCLWGIARSQYLLHYNDVIMGAMASQITSLTIVYSPVYWDADQRKHQSPASLAFVLGIQRGPVNSPHKWPVTRKTFPFDDVIIRYYNITIKPEICILLRQTQPTQSWGLSQQHWIQRSTNDALLGWQVEVSGVCYHRAPLTSWRSGTLRQTDLDATPWWGKSTWDRFTLLLLKQNFRQIPHIRRTKTPNLNVSRLFLQLSREWRCSWSSADRRCSNYIWVINNSIAY